MNRYLLMIGFIILASAPVFAQEASSPVMCTMEAKACPDGSYVSRIGPHCEFSPCPEQVVLPEDVAAFVEKRDICDHFRGEEPYDDDRRAEINKNLEESCVGTDQVLADLRKKYAENEMVLSRLSQYEDRIEDPLPLGDNLK